MTTANARSAVVAFGRQSSGEGSALSSPKYEIPMGSGYVGPRRNVQELPWTTDAMDSVGDYIQKVEGMVSCTIPLLPISCVPVLQGILGTRVTAGAGPYTHTMTPADSLPWMTWFFAQAGTGPANFWTLADAKLGSYEFSFAPGDPLEVTVEGMGKTTTRGPSKWSAATLVEGIDPFLTYIGATMKFDVGNTTPTTTVHNLQNGRIAVNRNLAGIQTDGLGNAFIAEQKREIEVTLDDVVFESNADINTIFTGTSTGTSMSGAPVYGSCEFLFLGSDQAASGTRSLKFTLPHVLWTVDEIPGADPSGDVLTYTVTGKASKPSSGSIITAVVTNGDSGSNY